MSIVAQRRRANEKGRVLGVQNSPVWVAARESHGIVLTVHVVSANTMV
jgi:hypothetical protein